ncbi:MAG: hypothetical protein LUH05_03940 [Candidatus Gastranaerophilales bacterium]|nr:hypothetical protein [Candidatus Gastranaerophilales bacterium]
MSVDLTENEVKEFEKRNISYRDIQKTVDNYRSDGLTDKEIRAKIDEKLNSWNPYIQIANNPNLTKKQKVDAINAQHQKEVEQADIKTWAKSELAGREEDRQNHPVLGTLNKLMNPVHDANENYLQEIAEYGTNAPLDVKVTNTLKRGAMGGLTTAADVLPMLKGTQAARGAQIANTASKTSKLANIGKVARDGALGFGLQEFADSTEDLLNNRATGKDVAERTLGGALTGGALGAAFNGIAFPLIGGAYNGARKIVSQLIPKITGLKPETLERAVQADSKALDLTHDQSENLLANITERVRDNYNQLLDKRGQAVNQEVKKLNDKGNVFLIDDLQGDVTNIFNKYKGDEVNPARNMTGNLENDLLNLIDSAKGGGNKIIDSAKKDMPPPLKIEESPPSQFGVRNIDSNLNRQIAEQMNRNILAEKELLNEYKNVHSNLVKEYGSIENLKSKAVSDMGDYSKYGIKSKAINDYRDLLAYEELLQNARYINNNIKSSVTRRVLPKNNPYTNVENNTQNILEYNKGLNYGQRTNQAGIASSENTRGTSSLNGTNSKNLSRYNARGYDENGLFLRRNGLWVVNPGSNNPFNNDTISKVSYRELPKNIENGNAFYNAISKAKTDLGNLGASVHTYTPEEYSKMKLFLSEDGLSGIAVKSNGDIVSAFANPKAKAADFVSKGNGRGHALIELAKQNGGVKLDAFDTYLPEFYKKHGFIETNRSAWNEKYKPSGWNKEYYKKYNNGEPDVVYMHLGDDIYNKSVSPLDLQKIKEQLGHSINWSDETARNYKNPILEQLYGRYMERLSSSSPELAKANRNYAYLRNFKKNEGVRRILKAGDNTDTASSALKNYKNTITKGNTRRNVNDLEKVLTSEGYEPFLRQIDDINAAQDIQSNLPTGINLFGANNLLKGATALGLRGQRALNRRNIPAIYEQLILAQYPELRIPLIYALGNTILEDDEE